MNKTVSPLKKNNVSHWNIAYYTIAALILAATLIGALAGRQVNSSDSFGSTTDGKLRLVNDREVRTDFSITRDNFKGVKIKFHETKRVLYGDETVLFYLRDNSTGEIVSRYELAMKNTLPQVGNFVPLAFDESEGKDVSLFIIGKNIKVSPYLSMSLIENMESELYVGNKHKRSYALVFTAVYQDRQAINFSALIKGITILGLWIIVGLWPILFRRAQKTAAVPEKEYRVKGLILTVFNKNMLLFLAISFIYLFLVVFVYKNNLNPRLLQTNSIRLVQSTDSVFENDYIVMDSSDDILSETFTAQDEQLSALSFKVAAEKANPDAMLHVQVINKDAGTVYYDRYVRLSSLPSSKSDWKFYLENQYSSSTGKTFEVRIEPVNFTSSEVHFYIGEAKYNVKSSFGGRVIGKLPILSTSYSDYGFLRPLYRCFSILVFVFLLMCFYMLVIRKWNAQKVYIPVCLFLGILYMLIIPVYSVPDEYAHIDTAYNLSNRLLGVQEPENMVGCDYRREVDIETEEYYTYNVTLDDYRRIYTEFFAHVPEQELVPCTTRSTDSNVDSFYFLPAAIGMVIGRILRLSTIPMYLLGRLFNLIAYVLITYLAIRKLNNLKEVFFIYATFPIGLQQAASFSYDCVLNAIALLFFAYCVHIALDKSVPGMMDVILLLFTALQMATVKGGVYAPMCLFLLLIPLEKRWKWTKNIPFFLILGGFLCFGFIQGNVVSLLNRLLPGTARNVSMFSGKEVYTFSYLIHHPMRLIRLYGNTVFQEGSRLVYEFFGGKMGSLSNIQMPWLYSWVFMVIMGVAIFASRKSITLSRVSKVLCAVGTLLTVLLIGAAMLLAHTPMDSLYITGLQGRYYIPVMMFLILCTTNTYGKDTDLPVQNSKEASSGWKLNMWHCMIHVVFLFNIIMIVLPVSKAM